MEAAADTQHETVFTVIRKTEPLWLKKDARCLLELCERAQKEHDHETFPNGTDANAKTSATFSTSRLISTDASQQVTCSQDL